MNGIKVSVITIVENNEDVIERCIDSLLLQALSDIEIIIVDNFSDDNSWEIVKKYENDNPGVIKLISLDEKGTSHARNAGIKAASGMYITFVDAGDYISKDLLSRLYMRAESKGFPEVISSPVCVTGIENQIKVEKNTLDIQEQGEMAYNDVYIFGRIFRSDVFETFGLFPDFSSDSELSWIYPVITNVDLSYKISSPGYYHYERKWKFCDADEVIAVSEFIYGKSNDEFKEYIAMFVLNRIILYVERMPQYKDVFFSYINDTLSRISNIRDIETRDSRLYQIVKRLEEHSKEIANIVYVDGFKQSSKEIAIKYKEAFRETANVVLLNEKNCDIESAPKLVKEAYENNNLEFVLKYFAIKRCYETGGIFIDADVQLISTFNMFKYDPSFFCYEKDYKFSDKVFGCCRENNVFAEILETYKRPELYEDKFAPLFERIKTVLIGLGNISCVSQNIERIQSGFCVYEPEVFVASIPVEGSISITRYNKEVFSDEECVYLPKEVLISYINKRIAEENKQRRKDIIWLKNQRKIDKNKIEELMRINSNQKETIMQIARYKKNIFVRMAIKLQKILGK